MIPTSCQMRHSHNFDKTYSFLKPVLYIFILRNLIVGWREEVIKEGIFCIKSIELGEVLIVGGAGFIKVSVAIIQGPLKHQRWNFLQNCFRL